MPSSCQTRASDITRHSLPLTGQVLTVWDLALPVRRTGQSAILGQHLAVGFDHYRSNQRPAWPFSPRRKTIQETGRVLYRASGNQKRSLQALVDSARRATTATRWCADELAGRWLIVICCAGAASRTNRRPRSQVTRPEDARSDQSARTSYAANATISQISRIYVSLPNRRPGLSMCYAVSVTSIHWGSITATNSCALCSDYPRPAVWPMATVPTSAATALCKNMRV